MRYKWRVIRHIDGVFERHCNLCGFSGKFRAFGYPPRYDAVCPSCNSLERHRLIKLCLDERGGLFTSYSSVLHFAPETSIKNVLRSKFPLYLSADLHGSADLVLNIENMARDDQSCDLVVCSHVLEHVDDRKALSEIYRILRPGGRALLLVPVIEGWKDTYENTAICERQDRKLHFGQEDHLRYFGSDFRLRIKDANFELEEFTAVEPYVSKLGLVRGETVFIAMRPHQ